MKSRRLGEKPIEHDAGRLAVLLPRFVPLTAGLTSVDWNGDEDRSDEAATAIDLSVTFGIPARVKAVLLSVGCRDSGSAGTRSYAAFGPAGGQWSLEIEVTGLVNDSIHKHTTIVPCDANGDIYYMIEASGAGTMNIWLGVWGYWV